MASIEFGSSPLLIRFAIALINVLLLPLPAEQQKQVINHRGSQLLVLGPAGSGKSSTLIKAIANRISSGEDPNSILAITYGRSSANKLRDQIASANPEKHTVNEPIARTFHSIAFLILNDQLANKMVLIRSMYFYQVLNKMHRLGNFYY